MATELELHPIQADILLVLLFKPLAKFGELNTTKMSTDHFTFHVKKLLEQGLIAKSGTNYCLTAKGKEFANRFDTDSVVLEKQAKVGVLITCLKHDPDGTKYLIQQRLKQPYYGFYGFMTGKIRLGETVEETAARELKEETGLEGEGKILGVKHKMDYSLDGKLLEDKFFFIVKVVNPKGLLIEEFDGGKNVWLDESEIAKLPDLFDGVWDNIQIMKDDKPVFLERKYQVKKF